MKNYRYTIEIRQSQMFPAKIIITSYEKLPEGILRDKTIAYLKNNFSFSVNTEEVEFDRLIRPDEVTLD